MTPARSARSLGSPQLVLVPTRAELAGLEAAGGFPRGLALVELAGFGPLAAAARTGELCARLRPRRILMVGIAGALGAHHEGARGSALAFGRVLLDGLAAEALGFAQWDEPRIGEALELAGPAAARRPELVSVLVPAMDPAQAAARRARFPRAAAEDMEAFGAALAARLAAVPLAVVRGISNRAGERDQARWRIAEALAAARALALELLDDESW